MALWVDKYRPNSLAKLDYHKKQALHLKNLVQQGDFPHLLVYGPSGAGKKTRIFCLLRELYGPGVERLRLDHMNMHTPSNKKIDITTVSSNYHLEVNPSDVGFHDRVVIQELIKTVAQTHQLDPSGQREFKVVVICEADCLTKDAQHALRRTMEKYVSTCRIILVANTAPTKEEIISILQSVCKKECLSLPNELAERIAVQSNRNLRRAILFLESCKVQQYPFQPDQKVVAHDWEIFLKDTAKIIVLEQSPQKLLEIRNRLYELIIHGIPSEFIFKGLLQELVKNCDMQLKTQVIEKAAFFEHRIHLGSKSIIHLEAFVASFMSIYKKFMEETVADLF
ncbi:replication factor C subunit 3 [Zootermopsis nevadensis]|uniref:replication factor C subunit 3 n=1 Tax=Zootermopsis nevadensis TaxID=136037 RepID=UPI000B8E2408|nr:replication factor C subunit 3 [Zootermopsis nevadensis]